MKVTVCIPTWNGERYLAETLRSVLAQSYENFECLVVDDASTDHTLDIVDTFKDSRIRRHVNPKQLGIARNYQHCLELACGEYINVFQQDDVMVPDNLERKLAVLDADPSISFVHSSAELLTSSAGSAEVIACYAPTDQVLDGNRMFRELLLTQNHICNPAVVARRQMMLDVGGYDAEADYTCDYEIWMKMCVNRRVGFVAEPLVKYRWHETNSTQRFTTGIRKKQFDRARNEAMRFYQLTSIHNDADLMRFALDQVLVFDSWETELLQRNAWLESQATSWQHTAEDLSRRLENSVKEWAAMEEHLRRELERSEHALAHIANSRIWRLALKLRSLFGLRRLTH